MCHLFMTLVVTVQWCPEHMINVCNFCHLLAVVSSLMNYG